MIAIPEWVYMTGTPHSTPQNRLFLKSQLQSQFWWVWISAGRMGPVGGGAI